MTSTLLICRYCADELVKDQGALVDSTGGDVCGWNGGNEPHEAMATYYAYRIMAWEEEEWLIDPDTGTEIKVDKLSPELAARVREILPMAGGIGR